MSRVLRWTCVAMVLLGSAPAMARGGDSALQMVIVLDDSGSMRRTDPRRLSITAAEIAAQLTNSGDSVALVPLNLRPTRLRPGGRNVRPLLGRLRALQRRSVQTIYDRPLSRAMKLLGGGAGVKLLLFLTDGEPDPGPNRDRAQALVDQEKFLRELAARCGATRIYPVLLGTLGTRWQSLFETVARRSHGKLFSVAQSGDKLIQAFAEIYAQQLGSKVVVQDLLDGEHTLARMDDYVRYANVVILSRGGTFTVTLPGSPAPRKVIDNGHDRGSNAKPVYHYVEKLRPSGPADLKIKLAGAGSYRALLIWDYDLALHLDPPHAAKLSGRGAVVRGESGGYELVAKLTRRSNSGAVIGKQKFLAGVNVRALICASGARARERCKPGPKLALRCDKGACAYRGFFVPPTPGTYQLAAIARRRRRGKLVFELPSVEKHTVTIGRGGALTASGGKGPLSIDQDKDSSKGPWQACQDWTVSTGGMTRPVRVKIDASALSLPDGVRFGVNGASGDTVVLRPGDRKLQVCLGASKVLDDPGLSKRSGKIALRALDASWFSKGAAVAFVPVTVEIKPRGFWNRYKRLLLYLGVGLLLLIFLIWLIRGFVAPHPFPEALKVNWGKSIDRLDRNEMPVSELSQAKRGFYRNAQLCVGGRRCFLESGWGQRARFEATGQSAISLFPEDGSEVLRVNKFDSEKRDPVKAGALVSIGDTYQVGDLFVRLKL
ncbi:MAG: VWA domain-containing protein [Myxococcales bacterium]|nr:VWA domain-containing protein [Myxococcales bacterium]